MQDGIIAGNGNSRYLKTVAAALSLYPTYEDFITALIAGTFPIDLNGINEAGWSQKGTPLNKFTLVSDTTETKIWGSAGNHTVDQVFSKILGSIGYYLIKEYTSPGNYTYTFDRKHADIFVVVVGAGGGGGSRGDKGGGGGGGGAAAYYHILDSDSIKNKNIVIGTGGAGAIASVGDGVEKSGGNGGTSSAFGIIAPGGNGGNGNGSGTGGGEPPWTGGSGGDGGYNTGKPGEAGPNLDILGFKFFCGGGGGGGDEALNDPPTLGGAGGAGGGGAGGAGATGQTNATNGTDGTRGGGGGGAGAGWAFRSSENKPSGNGGKGGDGYVAIYARGIS